jgi:hypothetical protein
MSEQPVRQTEPMHDARDQYLNSLELDTDQRAIAGPAFEAGWTAGVHRMAVSRDEAIDDM